MQPSGLVFDQRAQNPLWLHMFKKSVIRLGTRADFENREQILANIAADVYSGHFFPVIHGFLSTSRGKGVARFVPVFTSESTAVYFACVSAIDKLCAEEAVENTFGGWSLGGQRRMVEKEFAKTMFKDPQPKLIELEDETREMNDSQLSDGPSDDASGYMPPSPYNKAAWVENWQTYWKLLASTAEQVPDDHIFVSLDVANFYDSIDLVRLRWKLMQVAGHEGQVLSVLFKFLSDWNQAMRFYEPASKGVPMDTMGDMSRVLANFYLIEFDRFFKEQVEAVGGKYRRFADDFTFSCPTYEIATKLVYKASEKLHELGLNINTAKVQYRTKSQFEHSWGFKVMDLLLQKERREEGLLQLQDKWNDTGYERRDTAIRMSLSLLRNEPSLSSWRHWIYQSCLSLPEFVHRLNFGQMGSLMSISDDPLNSLRELCSSVGSSPYSEPKAHVLRCLEGRMKHPGKATEELFWEFRTKLLECEDPCLRLAAKHSPYGHIDEDSQDEV